MARLIDNLSEQNHLLQLALANYLCYDSDEFTNWVGMRESRRVFGSFKPIIRSVEKRHI